MKKVQAEATPEGIRVRMDAAAATGVARPPAGIRMAAS
jgi:hypothetical protein